MAKDKDTTSRITVYRLKDKVALTQASVEDYEKVGEGSEPTSGYEYALWFSDYEPSVPSWFPPFKAISNKVPEAKQAGFVLLVNTQDATYACTGGPGYHKLSQCFSVEPRFGMIVAKKILVAHELKGLVQKDASGVVNTLDRGFRGTYNPQGDIDNLHRNTSPVCNGLYRQRGQLASGQVGLQR